MIADTKSTSGRAFVRSLNILLKFARLYGFEHARTIEQLDIAWHELRAAIPMGTDNGLMLGATGSQLLLDGVPLEGAPAEKQFAQLLSAAGLASIQFFPSVTQDEIGSFARAFPTGKAKPTELARQLKAALTGAQGIRLNEICFVATDSRLKDASMAAQLAVASLGEDQNEFKKWLNDPQKLLELIAAAQGSKGGGQVGVGTGSGGSGSGDGVGGAGCGSRWSRFRKWRRCWDRWRRRNGWKHTRFRRIQRCGIKHRWDANGWTVCSRKRRRWSFWRIRRRSWSGPWCRARGRKWRRWKRALAGNRSEWRPKRG